jgi:hypothetical protein
MAYDATKDRVVFEIGTHKLDDKAEIVVQLVSYDGGPLKVAAQKRGEKRDGSYWYGALGRVEAAHAGPLAALFAAAAAKCAEVAPFSEPASAEATGRVVRRTRTRATAPATLATEAAH